MQLASTNEWTLCGLYCSVYFGYVGDFCLQLFMRDAKQAEVLLSQQDNFLSKEETPVSWSCLTSVYLHSQITSSSIM